MVARADQKFDANGNLTDEATRKVVQDQLLALRTWTLRLLAGTR
jgi:hypothetical protein